MSESSRESSFLTSVLESITRWLARARAAVFRAGFLYPDPSALSGVRGDWQSEVRGLLGELEETAAEAWQEESGREYVSNNSFVRAQLAMTENLLVRIPDEVYQRVFAEIADGTTNGESQLQIAERVDRVLRITGSEFWPNRARVIAQTETHRAWQAGTLASALYYEPATGPGWVKEWHTEMDGRERPSHKAANGQVRRLSEPFSVGNSLLRYPGDPSGPADEVINCVVGSTKIVAPQVRAAYRHWHEGPLLRIYTANGRILTVSPNHPVLAVQGWVFARQLVKGDNLIGGTFSNFFARSEPNVEAQPMMAQDVFDSLRLTWGSKRVSRLDVNFHGDRPYSDVEVVLPDRELSFGVDASIVQHLNEFMFCCAGAPTASGGPLFQPRIDLADPTDGFVGFEDLIGALLRGHSSPLEPLGFALGSRHNANFPKSATDGDAVNFEKLAQLVDGVTGLVSLDQVVDVQIDPFGHDFLYSFETASGVYMTNAVVSHNCRCDMIIRER